MGSKTKSIKQIFNTIDRSWNLCILGRVTRIIRDSVFFLLVQFLTSFAELYLSDFVSTKLKLSHSRLIVFSDFYEVHMFIISSWKSNKISRIR